MLAAILKETQIQELKCATTPEHSLLCQCPLTRLTTHLQTPPPQSWVQRARSQRRSRDCRGSQRQLDAAIAQVSRPSLEPAPECPPFCQRPLTLLLPLVDWPVTSSAASILRATAPTRPRASPSSFPHWDSNPGRSGESRIS